MPPPLGEVLPECASYIAALVAAIDCPHAWQRDIDVWRASLLDARRSWGRYAELSDDERQSLRRSCRDGQNALARHRRACRR